MNDSDSRVPIDLAWSAVAGVALVIPWVVAAFGPTTTVLADPWSAPKLLVLALAAALGCAALVYRVFRGGEVLRFNRRYAWAVGFLALATVSALAGADRAQALLGSEDRQGLLTLALYVAIGLVSMHAVRSPERVRRLQLAAVAGSIPVSLLALGQVAGFAVLTAGLSPWMAARGVGTIGNPDMLGGYLVWPLVLAPALALSEDRTGPKTLAWLAFALSAAAWFATLSRGAWIGGVLGLAVIAFAVRRLRVRATKADGAGLAATGVALVLALVVASREALPRMAEMFTAQGAVASGRLQIWEVGLKAIPERWLLGVGPDSFVHAYLPLRPMDYTGFGSASTFANDAHNYLIMLAVTVGVPGMLLAVTFLVSVVRQSWGVAFSRAPTPGRLAYAGWLAAAVGYCGYLFFGPGSVASNALLWVAFGVLLSAGAHRVEVSRSSLAKGVLAVVATASVVALGLTLAITASSMQLARSGAAVGGDALAHAVSASRIMPWLRESRLRVAEVAGFIAIEDARSGGAGAPSSAARAVAAYQELFALEPLEYEGRVMYAGVLLETGSIRGAGAAEEALAVAREAEGIFPAGLHARAAEAAALIALERPQEAVNALAEVWNLDATYSEPGMWYAYALWLAGDADEARDVVADLQVAFPGDPGVAWVSAEVQ